MDNSFDFEPVGTVGTDSYSSIEKKLDTIIEKLDEISKNISDDKVEEVAPLVEEPVVENITRQETPVELKNNIVEENSAEIPSEPILPENDKVEEPKEEIIEEPFSPVNVSEINLPEVDNTSNESNIIDINDLLAETPVIEPKKEEVKPEQDLYVTPIHMPTYNPDAEEIKPEEQPKIEPELAPEQSPIVAPEPVVTPIINPEPIEVEPTIVTPIEAPSTPVIEPKTEDNKPEIVEEQMIPAVEDKKGYSIVSELYKGMNEAKTGNDPHRVISVVSNNFPLKKEEEKTLVMNKTA